jgi:hypothetical protein
MCRTNLYGIYMRLIAILQTVNCESKEWNAFEGQRKFYRENAMRADIYFCVFNARRPG